MLNDLEKQDIDLVTKIVNEYLQNHYKITLKDIDSWFGYSLCNFVAPINGKNYSFIDLAMSEAVQQIASDIFNLPMYDFSKYNFNPGDVVLDLGAHVGIISIYLAKAYPFLKIYSYEPIRTNYTNFIKNIEQNAVEPNIITPNRKALTGDGRSVTLMYNPTHTNYSFLGTEPEKNFIINPQDRNIDSTTLDEIFELHDFKKVKLMITNCNGAEHEILKNCSKKNLRKIENIIGFFYQEPQTHPEWNLTQLNDLCKSYIKNVDVTFLEKLI